MAKSNSVGLFGTVITAGAHAGFQQGRRVYCLYEPPLWSSWLVLCAIGAFCLLLLVRKVRAYEVVS